VNQAEEEKAKADNTGGAKYGEKAVVKTEIGVRKRIVDLSDKIKGVVTVTDNG